MEVDAGESGHRPLHAARHTLRGAPCVLVGKAFVPAEQVAFFLFTLVTGPRRSLSLKRSDARVSRRERERRGSEPFALYAPYTGLCSGDVIKHRGRSSRLHVPSRGCGTSLSRSSSLLLSSLELSDTQVYEPYIRDLLGTDSQQVSHHRFRAKREPLQGQNLALAVLCVPNSFRGRGLRSIAQQVVPL